MLMELLEKVARRHDFRILLHEKPFAGVNGSGKHNNWSLGTNTGVNLLKPGNNPKTNLRFLTFFVNTLAALHRHADVVRASIASVGNDHRLGANEAPPAIMSAFIGSQLSTLLDDLESSIKAGKLTPADKTALKLEIGRIPEVLRDNTDRNRTSPFAFTGNKFELRAVGSTANCAVPMTVLNTIVADQLNRFKVAVDERIDKGDKKDDAILKELQALIKESKAIRFEGNGYGDAWVKEAKKRGLSNFKDTPSALAVWGRKEVAELFASLNVLTPEELHARAEVEFEKYVMKRQIEARVIGDIATSIVTPAAVAYQNMLIENISGMNEVFGKDAAALTTSQKELLTQVSEALMLMNQASASLREERGKINKIEDMAKRAGKYADVVVPLMEEVSHQCAHLEQLVDNEIWPLPKFSEMLFTR
jgi:glutamine synthetase